MGANKSISKSPLKNDQAILELLDIPYDSEDELGQIIIDNSVDEFISNDELYARLDEVSTDRS